MPKTLTAAERKTYPLYAGLFKYFPDALMEVAHVSWVGNEQHNPGEPLHWAREKSTDEDDALLRHVMDGVTDKFDTDGCRHAAKAAWRALARLQKEIESEFVQTITYPCGCSATGQEELPAYCPEHH